MTNYEYKYTISKNIISAIINYPEINHLIVDLLVSKLGLTKIAITLILLMI